MIRRGGRLVLVVVSLAAVSAFGRAGVASEQSSVAEAQALFRQGREAMKRGNYEVACALFGRSTRLHPALGPLLNLALCEEKLLRLLSARARLLGLLEEPSLDEERRAIARAHLDELEARVPRLVIEARPGATTPPRVLLDGRELSADTMKGRILVDPGFHALVFVSTDGRHQRKNLALSEGQTLVVRAPPGPGPRSETRHDGARSIEPAMEPTPSSGAGRTAGYVIGGVGAAGLLAAAVTASLALYYKGIYEDGCDDQDRCSPEGKTASETTLALGNAATIALAVGVVGVGTGAYLLFTTAPAAPSRAGGGAARPVFGASYLGNF